MFVQFTGNKVGKPIAQVISKALTVNIQKSVCNCKLMFEISVRIYAL